MLHPIDVRIDEECRDPEFRRHYYDAVEAERGNKPPRKGDKRWAGQQTSEGRGVAK